MEQTFNFGTFDITLLMVNNTMIINYTDKITLKVFQCEFTQKQLDNLFDICPLRLSKFYEICLHTLENCASGCHNNQLCSLDIHITDQNVELIIHHNVGTCYKFLLFLPFVAEVVEVAKIVDPVKHDLEKIISNLTYPVLKIKCSLVCNMVSEIEDSVWLPLVCNKITIAKNNTLHAHDWTNKNFVLSCHNCDHTYESFDTFHPAFRNFICDTIEIQCDVSKVGGLFCTNFPDNVKNLIIVDNSTYGIRAILQRKILGLQILTLERCNCSGLMVGEIEAAGIKEVIFKNCIDIPPINCYKTRAKIYDTYAVSNF